MEKDFKKWGYLSAILLILIFTVIYFLNHFIAKDQSVTSISSSGKNLVTTDNGTSKAVKAIQSMTVSVSGEVLAVDGEVLSLKNEEAGNDGAKIVRVKIVGEIVAYTGAYNKQGGFDEKGKTSIEFADIKIGQRINVALTKPVSEDDLYNSILTSGTTTLMPAMPAGAELL